ncbi:MAG TPA: hypothetical protein VKZ68_05665 [Ohtaekwangia sp.]|nr:hypothetical protein [Ohtaekwangia sp.]
MSTFTSDAAVRMAGIDLPPVKVKPFVDIEVLSAIEAEILEDSYVYVHCYLDSDVRDMLIRIWRTTFLVDRNSGSRSKLVHAENVSFAPMWTMVPDGKNYNFLLIFSSLPKSCTHFDLIEEVPSSGGFHITNIQRNTRDVYHIDIR